MNRVIKLFDPPMGSPSGIGLYSDQAQDLLLRIATLLYYMEEHGIVVERANLSTAPKAFLDHPGLMNKLMQEGDDFLPALYNENGLLLSGRYPENAEIAEWYDLPELAEALPPLPTEAFVALWQEAEAWGMCSSGSCDGCSGCG
ncbi:MAG: arsenic metallochaperone ArsD family protein [Clostridia bacterium]|nr:arsenic metallochaperone ArsD family protein [Clostridia bacterium]NLF20478.1 arsenic metallochaperone ArsD family protein [Clostridiaceae bacterium]